MTAFLLTCLTLISLYYQSLILNELTILSYVPSIILPLMIYSHFYVNISYHSVLFFLVGLALDVNNPQLFGINTFAFMVLSYLITLIKNHLDMNISANKLAMISLCNGAYYLLYYLVSMLVFKQALLHISLSFIISLILNTVLSLILISVLDFLRMLKFSPNNE